jgi:hypothetical protein
MLIDREHPILSLSRQCELLELPRSTYYFESTGESSMNLALMKLIDEEYTRHPFYGYRKMTVYLNGRGYEINGPNGTKTEIRMNPHKSTDDSTEFSRKKVIDRLELSRTRALEKYQKGGSPLYDAGVIVGIDAALAEVRSL